MFALRVAFMTVLLVSGVSVSTCAQASAEDSSSVSKLLTAAKVSAGALVNDAAEMTTFAHGSTDWSHDQTRQRTMIQHIEKADETVRELQEMRQIASADQSAAIDSATPLIRELIHNTQAMRDHIKADPDGGHSQSCIEYLAGHQQLSLRLASRIADAVDHRPRSR